ncbi:MAG: DUF2750 domain-containing protein [Planctomycetes bacterium]|nr:DUF2750 domain-containing protein [Planctomycetota bacterium]
MWPNRLIVSTEEQQHVLALDAVQRCSYALKRFVDTREAWVLWSEDLGVVLRQINGQTQVQLWPAMQYAGLYVRENQINATPIPVYLLDILDRWIDHAEAYGWIFTVFPTSRDAALELSSRELEQRVCKHMEDYE